MTSGALSRPVKSLIETIIGASGFTNVTVFGSKVAGGVGNGGKTGALVVVVGVGVGVGDAEVLAGVGEELVAAGVGEGLVAAGVGDEVGEDVGEAVVLVGDGEAVGELKGDGEVEGEVDGELNGDGEEVGVPLPGQVCDKRIPESEPRIVA